ncbi:MAG: autotransporter outer membrane beta-barrel domain-containing protein [Rhodospirillaceae bacterium]
MISKTAIAPVAICLAFTAAAFEAQAQTTLTLANGSIVTVVPGGLDLTGSLGGTIQQGGVSSAFTCGYNTVTGQVSGSPACGQILGGSVTGGLNVQALEHDLVNVRLNVASEGMAAANVSLLNDLATRRIGLTRAVSAQAGLQSSETTDATNVFGDPQYGAWASAGLGFFNDERFGLERDGDSKVFTAGVDHTVENWMVGIYAGYLDTKVDLISLGGDLSSDGWLMGAYATRVLDEVFSITGAGSYADSEAHLSRISAGTPVRAAIDHMEWSASLSGNAFWLVMPQFGVTATAGLSYDKWRDDEYTDSLGVFYNETSGENFWAKFGGTATFFTGALRPYANVTYARMITQPDFYAHRNRVTVGAGLALGTGPLSGVFEVNTQVFNDDQRDTAVGFHLRLAV